MSDQSEWHDGPAWLLEAGAAEGWGTREWLGWEIARKRLDEVGPFDLEMTADGSTIGAYGDPGTFLEEVRGERVPIYEAVNRLLAKIVKARREGVPPA
jgi:hypothetical protein